MGAELERAKRYRLIAQRLRAMANDLPQFRQPLILTAEDYDGMAKAIEAICWPYGMPVIVMETPFAGLDDPE
jgi:hypothetical protein